MTSVHITFATSRTSLPTCPTCRGVGVIEPVLRDSCVLCRRAMQRGTKPKWVIGDDYRVLGKAHSVCGNKVFTHSYPATESARFAQLRAFVWDQKQKRGSDAELASFLTYTLSEMPTDELDEAKQEILDWWINGPMQLGEARREGIVAEYRALLQRFRATVPPPGEEGG